MSNQTKSSKNQQVKAMQLFYEVKQKFPTVPDHTITSKINRHLQSNLPIETLLDVMREIAKTEEHMGRPHQKVISPVLDQFKLEQDNILDALECGERLDEAVEVSGEIKINLGADKLLKESNVQNVKISEPNSGESKNINSGKGDKNDVNVEEMISNIANIPSDKMNNNFGENKISTEDLYNENNNCDIEALSNLAKLNLGDKLSDKKLNQAIRPSTLDFNSNKAKFKIQPSEKCTDVFTLLNSPNYNEKHPKILFSEKPPRSPLSAKRLLRNSPVIPKKETVSTPSQTTDTLVNNPSPSANKVSTPCQTTDTLVNNGSSGFTPSVNVSINCEMMQSPVTKSNKRSTMLEMTPAQPWLNPAPNWMNKNGDQSTSPRSFTSVNLTLRPPSSTPQDPIDITSQNSSMTYSTSSFDSQRGLQSRLQITVGPSGANTVTSVRARPNSSYLPQLEESSGEVVPARAVSLNNLEDVSPETPVLLRQQARIDKMRIELRTGYARLVIMRKEVEDLERKRREDQMRRAHQEIENQLRKEVGHLKSQVEQLSKVEQIFYNNLYTGPSLTESLPRPSRPAPAPPNPRRPVRPAPPAPDAFGTVPRRLTRGGLQYQGPPMVPFQEIEGAKWNCSKCTFLNHPDLDWCEACEMPRVLHGNNSNVAADLTPLLSLPGPSHSAGNPAEARNQFISLQTNLYEQNRPETPSILHSLTEALKNTTSLVALKDIPPQDGENQTDSMRRLKKSADVLKNFQNNNILNGESSSGSQSGSSFQNFVINTTSDG